jgi:hypothetical protein
MRPETEADKARGMPSFPRDGKQYTSEYINTQDHLIEFVTDLPTGTSTFWFGHIKLADFSSSGVDITGMLGAIGPETIIAVQFGVDNSNSPYLKTRSKSDFFSDAPIYEGRVTDVKYELRNDGVIVTCELQGQTALRMNGDDYLKKMPMGRPIALGQEEFAAGIAARLSQALANPRSQRDWFDKDGKLIIGTVEAYATSTKPPLPHEAFRALASAAGWPEDSLVVEEVKNSSSANGEPVSEYCYVTRNIMPEPNETYVSAAKKLAAHTVNQYGETYLFYVVTTPGGRLEYHFHSPSRGRVRFVDNGKGGMKKIEVYDNYQIYEYGGASGDVIDAQVDYKMAFAAMLGAGAEARAYTADMTGRHKENSSVTRFTINNGYITSADSVTYAQAKSDTLNKPNIPLRGNMTAPEAYQVLAGYLQKLRQRMIVMNIVVSGTNATLPLDVAVFNYFLRGVPHFTSKEYRVMGVKHVVNNNGWTTYLEGYSDEVPEELAPIRFSELENARASAQNQLTSATAGLDAAQKAFKSLTKEEKDALATGKAANWSGAEVQKQGLGSRLYDLYFTDKGGSLFDDKRYTLVSDMKPMVDAYNRAAVDLILSDASHNIRPAVIPTPSTPGPSGGPATRSQE